MDSQPNPPSNYSPIPLSSVNTKSSLPFTELDQILSTSLFAKANKSTPDRSTQPSKSFTQISPIKKSLNKFSRGLRFLKSITEKPSRNSLTSKTDNDELRARTLSEEIIHLNFSANSCNSFDHLEDCSPKTISEDLRLIVNNKLENLEKALNTITSFEQGIFNKVEEALIDKEQALLKTVDTKFEEYLRLLTEKRSDISSKISSHFGELREKVREKSYPHESQYEAKTKVIEWKHLVKRKIDTWKTAETVEVANDVIEEDETAMVPEIKVWMNRVENMVNLGNLDALIDKSLLVFDDDFAKKIESLCEFKALLEDSLVKAIPKTNEKDSSSKDDSFSGDNTDKIAFIKKFFKVHQLKVNFSNEKDFDRITLKPNNTLLPTASSKTKKNQKFKFEDFADFPHFDITCEDFKDKHLIKLSEALKSFITLRELTVQFSQCDGLRDASLDLFGSTISELSSLQHLKIQCDSSLKCLDETLIKLVSKIADNSNIQSLELAFSGMIGVTSEGFIQIWKEFLRMPNLTKLKVSISDDAQFNDEGILKISENLRQMMALRSLEIKLKGSDKITNKGFVYLNESLSKLIGLEELNISFVEESGCFNDRSFSGVIQTLSKLTMLKSLTLAFPKNYVSNEKIAEFSQVLAKFSHLRKLKLDFSWSLLGDESLFELAKAVSCLLYLTSLEVDFTACSVSNKGFQELVKATSGLFNLNKLGLDFAWCREITDEGLISVGEAVTKLDNLVKIVVNFKEVRKVSEIGVLKFCEMLLKCNGIEELEMDLMNCGRDLTEESKVKIDGVLNAGRKQINNKIIL